MKLRITLLALLIAGAAALALSGAYEQLAPEKLRETILSLGPLGPVLFVVSFAVLEPFSVPGLIFLLTAPLVWPLPVAFLLSLAGGTGAGLVALVIARFLARDWVQERLPDRLRAWDDRLADHGFRTVVLIRLLTFLWPAAHWVIGLSSVRVAPAILGTAVGLAPAIFLFTWLGSRVMDWALDAPTELWLSLLAGALALTLILRLRARRATEPRSPA